MLALGHALGAMLDGGGKCVPGPFIWLVLVCVACSDPGADRGRVEKRCVEGSRRQSMLAVHGTLYPHRTGLRW